MEQSTKYTDLGFFQEDSDANFERAVRRGQKQNCDEDVGEW